MQNNNDGFQNNANNTNMNYNNTMLISSNFKNDTQLNKNNNNFKHQNVNSNISLTHSQSLPSNRNIKKLNIKFTKDEQILYSKLYNMLDNNNSGKILGKPAANFMRKSNLPKNVLKDIWLIAAQTSNIFILKDEFFVAMRLIALAQNNMPYTAQNIEMNNPIPPLPNFDLNNNNNQNNQNNNHNNNQNNNQNNKKNINQNNNQNIYEISEKEKDLLKNIFNNLKEPNDERITAHNAIIMWKNNNVDDNIIKTIAKIIKPLENKGFFNLKEFQVASHLINISKKCELPQKLPDILVNYLGRTNNIYKMNDNNFNTIEYNNSRMNSSSTLSQFFNNNNNNNNNDKIEEILRKEEELIKINNALSNQINLTKNKINELFKEIEIIQKRQDNINNELANLRKECNILRNSGNSNNTNNKNNKNNKSTKNNKKNVKYINKKSDKNISFIPLNNNYLSSKNLESIGKSIKYDLNDLNDLNINKNNNLAHPQSNKNNVYPNLENKKPDKMDINLKNNNNNNNNNMDVNNNNNGNNGNNDFNINNNNNGNNINNINEKNTNNSNVKKQYENKQEKKKNKEFDIDSEDDNPYKMGIENNNNNNNEDNGSTIKNGDDEYY